jgi:hypothetical protein
MGCPALYVGGLGRFLKQPALPGKAPQTKKIKTKSKQTRLKYVYLVITRE